MKGINIKKLAAIATGAALLGSAIAPMVSAIDIAKEDIYNSNGSPKVNIVVGSDAALSDAVWAGNLAAKIAEKAAESKTVSTSATGENGELSSAVDLSELTVDVTVGGVVTFGAGSKEYKVNLNSAAGQLEISNTTPDANMLSDSQLAHLYNATTTQKVAGTTTTPTITEHIGLDVDAKFSTSSGVQDLVAYIEGGDFYYKVKFNGTSGIDLGTNNFTDGTTDNVKIIFFGEEYLLSRADLNTTIPYLRLVKSSAKETYNEGEEVQGLIGAGAYDGEEMAVKLVQIVQLGAATTTYQATFELYDAEGNLVDTQTLSSDSTPNLKDSFQDSDGAYALSSNLYINTIAVGSTTGVGYVEVTKGTDTLELYNSKGYPYDSTDTSGIYDYTVTLDTATANTLKSIKISNSREKWNSSASTNEPLYPTKAGQSLQGRTGEAAVFGNTFADGVLGKGFAKVEFLGFEADEDRTLVEIGRNVIVDSSATGGLKFKGADDAEHNIPFALELDSTDTGSTFSFDGKTIWYNSNFGTDTTATNDYNFHVSNGAYVNGRIWEIESYADGNANIDIDGVMDQNVLAPGTFVVDGVTFTLASSTPSATSISVSVDGMAEFRKDNSTGTQLYNIAGAVAGADTNTYGKFFYSEDTVFDSNATAGNLELIGTQDRGVKYAINPAKTLNRLWLMLDADIMGMDEGNVIQNSKIVKFLGTTYPTDASYTEVKLINETLINDNNSHTAISGNGSMVGYYLPRDTDFSSGAAYSNSNAYFVANFVVDDIISSADFNVYIDTSNGGNLGPFNNSNLTGYSSDVDFAGTNTLTLTSGTGSDNYYTAAYTDFGTKAWLLDDDAGVKVSMVENREQVQIVVYGTESTRAVAGGETVTLSVGNTVTTDAGTELTLESAEGATCAVSGADGDVACTATPATYASPAAVRNPLVYLDSEAPAGTNIIVGGHIVNSLASGLVDRLTSPGQTVAEVDGSGNIYVAGYVAEDTVSAVKELIDAIDAMEMA